MLNVATNSALAAFNSTGVDGGETSHPCGAASLSSPFTAPVAAVTRTETGLAWLVGNTNTFSRTFTNTGGAITNGRGGETSHPCGAASLSSPFTAPVAAVKGELKLAAPQ